MGNFYVNFTVKRDDPQAIAAILRDAGRKAYVTPVIGGHVVVFEEESDTQDDKVIEEVGALLSREARAPTLAVLNHDDDVLLYWLFEDGRLSDSYNSRPDDFDFKGEGEPAAPAGGDARRLREALSASSETDRVDAILRNGDYVFAFEQHMELLEALGLPDCAVGLGYGSIERGELPDELPLDQLIHVG